MVERWLPTPEIHGSNPVIGKCYVLSTVLKRRNWRKRGREWSIDCGYVSTHFHFLAPPHGSCNGGILGSTRSSTYTIGSVGACFWFWVPEGTKILFWKWLKSVWCRQQQPSRFDFKIAFLKTVFWRKNLIVFGNHPSIAKAIDHSTMLVQAFNTISLNFCCICGHWLNFSAI